MNILIFTDLHQDFESYDILLDKSKKADHIICLGDFTFFNHNLELMLELINNLGNKTRKVYLIHGNHEQVEHVKIYTEHFENIIFVHNSIITIDTLTAVFFGGGGFASREPDFEKLVRKHKDVLHNAKDIILCTHAPPRDTILDEVHERHVGVKDFKDFIEKYEPVLAVSGHIEEHAKEKQVIGKTLVTNPGEDGEIFEL
ncbi:MAG: metallophosphoesterase family protein [Candidatus Woesearchaeota archaeon]